LNEVYTERSRGNSNLQMKTLSHISAFIIAVLLVPGVTCASHNAQAQTTDSVEYQLKAALVYKLAAFTKWPKNSFEKKDDPIKLTILGNRKLYEAYSNIEDRKIGKRTLEVSFAETKDDIAFGHIIYVDANESESFFAKFEKQPEGVLVIGDSKSFAEVGGIIQISVKNNKPHLKVNMTASKRARVRIDAQVLEISEIYKEP